MRSEWQTYTLDNIAQIISGGTPKTSNRDYWGGEIPWLSVVDFNNGRRYVKITEKSITDLGLKNSPTKLLCPGDTIISARGTVGVVAQLDRLMAFNQSCYGLRAVTNLVIPDFLYYVVKNVSNELKQLANGGVFDTIIRETFSRIKVKLPAIDEQTRIAGVLSSLDDCIENLRETNTTLESIAQALFKSWFVDFDPVRAKAEGREPEGMNTETAALFPDGFEESELGLVPRNWKVSSLRETTSYLSRGISPRYIEKDGIIVINQKCIRDNVVDLAQARKHDTKQRKIEGRELLIGDILVNSTGVGTLGRAAQILSVDMPLIVDSHVTVVRASESLTWNYLGLSLLNRQSEIEQLGEGSTGQTELSKTKLEKLKLIIPNINILYAFDSLTLSFRERFSTNLKQIKSLNTLRDTLLPRLISGHLRLDQVGDIL